VTYSPWRHVEKLADVLVRRVRLEHAEAYWDPGERVILLDDRLLQHESRSHLAHELAHLERGDECLLHGPDADRLEARQERAADEHAAEKLISLDALADALAWALGPEEVAHELHVTTWAVTARLRSLTAEQKHYIERRIAAKGEVA
jgi:hypothetical protein